MTSPSCCTGTCYFKTHSQLQKARKLIITAAKQNEMLEPLLLGIAISRIYQKAPEPQIITSICMKWFMAQNVLHTSNMIQNLSRTQSSSKRKHKAKMFM